MEQNSATITKLYNFKNISEILSVQMYNFGQKNLIYF